MQPESNALRGVPREVRVLEQTAANALTPTFLQLDEGWRLRAEVGGPRRANSVLAELHVPGASLDEKIARAEAFYARLGQPTRFQLCVTSQPPQLGDVLAARGYRTSSGAAVQRVPLMKLLGHLVEQEPPDAVLAPELTEGWLELFSRGSNAVGERLRAKQRLFARIASPAAFVTVRLAGLPAAVGLGILERGQLGLFDLATLPSLRCKGAAQAVIHTLAIWGAQLGAGQMYLQVAEENRAARALYARLGFETLYTYHYRERD